MKTTFSIIATILLVGSDILHAKDAIRLAVIYFENAIPPERIAPSELGSYKVDPRYIYLERAFTEMLITDLAGNPGIELLERSRVGSLLDEIHLGQTGLIDRATAQKAGKALSADVLLYGIIEKTNHQILIRPVLHWFAPYKLMELRPVKTPNNDLIHLETKLASAVRRALHSSVIVRPNPQPVVLSGGTYAVLPFDNNSGDYRLDYLRRSISDLLSAAISTRRGLQLVERERLQSIIEELQLGHSGWIDIRTALKMGSLLGAKYILFGSFVQSHNKIRLDVRLSLVESGQTLSHIKSLGEPKRLKEVIDSLVKQLR